MSFALNFVASEASAAPLKTLWMEFGRFEDAPSMFAMDYPPHVTLAVYEAISEDSLREALHLKLGILPPLRLSFAKIAFVEKPELVF